MEDPFLLDQNRVESHLAGVGQQLQRWRQLRDTDQQLLDQEDRDELEEEFHCLSNEISQSVKSIGWDLDDLQETLQMMLDARAPQVTAAADRDSRAAFVAKSRSFLDEVAREVGMTTNGAASGRVDSAARDEDVEAGAAGAGKEPLASRPLLSWRKDTDELTFPSVELNSLNDLRKGRFHNRDWTGFFYRYRYLLAMVAAICLIIFFTVVALAAKHTAARSAQVSAVWPSTAAPGSTTTVCRHPYLPILC